MRAASWLNALAIGLGTYLLLELVFGGTGWYQYERLAEHTQRVESQLSDVQRRNAELRRTIDRLRADVATIEVEARELGIVRAGERVVLIEGRDRTTPQHYDPGTSPAPPPKPIDARPFFRSVALAASIIAFIMGVLRDAQRPRRVRKAARESAGEGVSETSEGFSWSKSGAIR